MRTNQLRKLVKTMLSGIHEARAVYYVRADENALFPHISFILDRAVEQDFNRHDYTLIVDVWDKGDSDVPAEDLADKVENIFNNANQPQSDVLPTFFLESRRTILDEDKTIKHIQLDITIQNYEVTQ